MRIVICVQRQTSTELGLGLAALASHEVAAFTGLGRVEDLGALFGAVAVGMALARWISERSARQSHGVAGRSRPTSESRQRRSTAPAPPAASAGQRDGDGGDAPVGRTVPESRLRVASEKRPSGDERETTRSTKPKTDTIATQRSRSREL